MEVAKLYSLALNSYLSFVDAQNHALTSQHFVLSLLICSSGARWRPSLDTRAPAESPLHVFGVGGWFEGEFQSDSPAATCNTAPETTEIKGSSDDVGGNEEKGGKRRRWRAGWRREPGEVDGVLVNNA